MRYGIHRFLTRFGFPLTVVIIVAVACLQKDNDAKNWVAGIGFVVGFLASIVFIRIFPEHIPVACPACGQRMLARYTSGVVAPARPKRHVFRGRRHGPAYHWEYTCARCGFESHPRDKAARARQRQVARGGMKVVVALMCVALAAWGLVLLYKVAPDIYRASTSRHWLPVKGTVTASGAAMCCSGVSYAHVPWVRYAYWADNTQYTGNRIRFGPMDGSCEVALTVARAYPTGTSVVVHYNPARAEESVLEPAVSPGAWRRVRRGVILLALGLFGCVLLWKRGRKGGKPPAPQPRDVPPAAPRGTEGGTEKPEQAPDH